MAPAPGSSYFPSLDICLSGEAPLISWRTAFNALCSSSTATREDPRLRLFLADPRTLSLLSRPFNYPPPPSPHTKANYETRTAAIHAPSNTSSEYDLDQIKEDALWLSKQANIDESEALRIVLLEWQSRSTAQLSAGFNEEDLAGPQDAGAAAATLGSSFLVSQSALTPSDLYRQAFSSPLRRRLRLFQQYLSDRRYIIKVSESLVRTACDNPSRDSDSDGPEDSDGNKGSLAGFGNIIVDGRTPKPTPTRSYFLEECVQALQSRMNDIGQGSGWFEDDDQVDVEADWGRNLLIEMIHIMQTIFLTLFHATDITPSPVILAWFRFASTYGFFDEAKLVLHLIPRVSYYANIVIQTPPKLLLPLQSLVAIVSLTILKLPLSLQHLLELSDQRSLPSTTPDTSFILDPKAIGEINSWLLEAAAACFTTASPAVFAWSILLQTLRDIVLSRRAAKELRQSQHAVDKLAEDDGSETEEGDDAATRPERRSSRRQSSGSDISMEPSMYDEVLETIMDTDLDGDPVEFLAKSAVNGSQVFMVARKLALEFCPALGADDNGTASSNMRQVLLELISSSLEWVQYLPEVVEATLAALTGGTRLTAIQGHGGLPTTAMLASKFIQDDTLVEKMLRAAYARFPFEALPFLSLLNALSAIQETDDDGMIPAAYILSTMDSLTQALPADFRGYATIREEENSNQIVLTSDVPLFSHRSSKKPRMEARREPQSALVLREGTAIGDGLVVRRHTRGRVLLESNPIVVEWDYQYSGLTFVGRLLESALPNSEVYDVVAEAQLDKDTVSEIVGLITNLLISTAAAEAASGGDVADLSQAQGLLAEASDGLGRNRDIIATVFELFENELQRDQSAAGIEGSLDLLVNCMHFFSALMGILPGRVWPLFGRSALLERGGSGGRLAALIASNEMVTGRFDFLIACIRMYEMLVDDVVNHAIVRRCSRPSTGRFDDSGGVGDGGAGTGVPDKVMSDVLLAYQRTLVDVFESSPNWRFLILDERLEMNNRILSVFQSVLRHAFGVDDDPSVHQKLTAPLDSAASFLVDVFLGQSANNLPVLPILRIVAVGVSTPDTTLFLQSLNLWTAQVRSAVDFSTLLLRVNSLLNRPSSHFEEQLFKACPLLARVYAVHESYRHPVVALFEAMVISASSATGEPPSLLGHLGPETAKCLLGALSDLGKPLDDIELEEAIWRFLSAVVSHRQQWFAVYLLTGDSPRAALSRTTSGPPSSTGRSLFTTALDMLSDIRKVPPTKALVMLEFVALAEDHWPWAVSEMRGHPKFLSALSDFIGTLDVKVNQRHLSESLKACQLIRMASYVADIFAMHIHHTRQFGDHSFAKQIISKMSYFVQNAVRVPSYNSSLHANLRRNFESKFSPCNLMLFRHTKLERRQLGTDLYYDINLAARTLARNTSWKGVRGSGLAEEVERANVNLSLVEAQVALLHSWKSLAVELTIAVPTDPELQKAMANVVQDCLMANASTQQVETIFTQLVEVRASLAFVLMQRLTESHLSPPMARSILDTTWSVIRNSGTTFQLALAAGDAAYYRSLLKTLLLAIRTFVQSTATAQSGDDTLGGSTQRTREEQQSSREALQMVVQIVNMVVGGGFRELAAAVHEMPAESSPEDIALITAIFQTGLRVPGVGTMEQDICSSLAEHGTARTATTLFSWCHQLGPDDDPVYGELAVFLLLALSSMPMVAENMAVDGLLPELSNARLMSYYRRGVAALNPNQRLYSIWTRGILPLCLNLLQHIGGPIAPELTSFLGQFQAQLQLSAANFGGRPVTSNSNAAAGVITLSMASEAHSLALLYRIIEGLRASSASSGLVASEIVGLAWDASSVREDVEVLLQSRRSLREKMVPVNEAEADMMREKPLDGKSGCESRLEEKVVSPFQAILDYERARAIPVGWVNYAISRTSPDGAWHRLERGEIKMDDGFFNGFNADLRNRKLWEDFHARSASTRTDDGQVREHEGRVIPPLPEIDAEYLFWEMMRVSRTPDPWMYPALKRLKGSGRYLLGALSNAYIFPAGHPYNEKPAEDVRDVFDVFVSSAHVGLRKPDPSIYHLAVEWMDRFARERGDEDGGTRGKGMGWEQGVKAQEVVFLDDIGENLKAAKQLGMRTIKVNLGKGYEAVRELEEITGLDLLGDAPAPKL
ncbi:MAG: hypothetical protein M1817_004095 [Caeruleum heppii]|nr:MAG: hypothetical protein M1817_004095 [Caeruleum heppii]